MAKRAHDEVVAGPPAGDGANPSEGPKRCKQDQVILRGRLGSGVYGTVYAVDTTRGPPLAMKLLKSMEDKTADYEDLAREAYGLSTSGMLEGLALASDLGQAAVFMPGYGRRLHGVIPPVCPPEQLAYILRPVAEQLAAMEGMHRDVKPQNMVMNGDRAVLVDFSLATNLPVSKDSNVVTLWYRAPEIIIGGMYSKTVDIWSLGITMLHLLMGSLFSRVSKEADVIHFLLDVLDHFGWPTDWPELYEFLDKHIYVGTRHGQRGILIPYLQKILVDRAGGEAMKASRLPALVDAADLVTRMCAVRPVDRITWSDVLCHRFWTHALAPVSPIPCPSLGAVSSLSFMDHMRMFWIERKAHDARHKAVVPICSAGPDKDLIVYMDWLLQYSMMFEFSIDTAIRAFQIHGYALKAGMKPTVATLCASLFLASAYNEDVRCRKDMTWHTWSDMWSIKDPHMPLVKATILKVLCATRAEWPSWGLKHIEEFTENLDFAHDLRDGSDGTPEEFEGWMTPFMVCYGSPSTWTSGSMKTLAVTLSSMLGDLVCHPNSSFDWTGKKRE